MLVIPLVSVVITRTLVHLFAWTPTHLLLVPDNSLIGAITATSSTSTTIISRDEARWEPSKLETLIASWSIIQIVRWLMSVFFLMSIITILGEVSSITLSTSVIWSANFLASFMCELDAA